MTLEELVDFLRKDEKSEKKFIVNKQRQIDFAKSYRALEALIQRESINVTVYCEVGELIDGYAVIKVVGDDIVVREMSNFATAVINADNMEVFAKDDVVEMNFMFHNIRTRVA